MDTDEQPPARGWRIAQTVSVWATLAGLVAVAVLALTNHPHRAVLLLGGGLVVFAVARALWPGRPWFASRWRWLDVAFYAGLGALVWFLSPFTATMGVL